MLKTSEVQDLKNQLSRFELEKQRAAGSAEAAVSASGRSLGKGWTSKTLVQLNGFWDGIASTLMLKVSSTVM